MIGGLLICGGLGTLVSTLLVKDKTDQRNLLIASGGQLVIWSIMFSTNKPPNAYYFKEYKRKKRWHFEDKRLLFE